MNIRRYAKRRDGNQTPIMEALEAIGVGVIDLSDSGKGIADLLTVHRGQLGLLEIKNPDGRGNRLTPAQVDLHQKCRTFGYTIPIVESVEQALALFGAK